MNYLIAIPAMDWCPVPFTYSLATLQHVGPTRISLISGAAVHEAREELATEAIKTGADRVLWLDSDMQFSSDVMARLAQRLDEGWDLCCGIYTKRRLPVSPVIYEHVDLESGEVKQYLDYPQDSLFDVAGCGFGCVMTSVALLKRIQDAYGALFMPVSRLSEDLSFCARARALGARMACDSTIKVGHVGLFTYGEQIYRRPGAVR